MSSVAAGEPEGPGHFIQVSEERLMNHVVLFGQAAVERLDPRLLLISGVVGVMPLVPILLLSWRKAKIAHL